MRQLAPIKALVEGNHLRANIFDLLLLPGRRFIVTLGCSLSLSFGLCLAQHGQQLAFSALVLLHHSIHMRQLAPIKALVEGNHLRTNTESTCGA